MLDFSFLCCFGNKKSIESDFDPRYGNLSITSPLDAGFTSPRVRNQASPTSQHSSRPAPLTNISSQESRLQREEHLSLQNSPRSRKGSVATSQSQPNSPFGAASFTSNASIPVHEAFVPGIRHTMRTVPVSPTSTQPSPSLPQSSPPASPPLPTPNSIQSRLIPIQPSMYPHTEEGSPGLAHTMSKHQQRAPNVQIVPALDTRHNEKHNWTPESAHSVEQWPGNY